VVEPLIKPQWYVDCTGMAKEAVRVSHTLHYTTNADPSIGRWYGARSLRLFQSSTRRPGTSGWRTVVIGVSPDSCGGDTASQPTLLPWMTPQYLKEM